MSKAINQGKHRISFAIALAIALLMLPNAIALGIIPGHHDVNYEPGKTVQAKIKLLNEGGHETSVFLYVEGPLEQYIGFSESIITFSSGETEKIITYTIDMPPAMKKQGITETKIVARAIPVGLTGDTIIGASVAVVSKLRLIIPYSGKYAEVRLIVPPFEQNKEAAFVIEVKNLGKKNIIAAQAVIDIYGPLNNKLDTVKSKIHKIKKEGKKILNVNWKAVLPPGSYTAKLNLTYDEKNAYDEASFNIGRQEVRIDGISVNNFRLGGIARFEILVSNNWHMPAEEIFADIQVSDREDRIYTQSRTATTSVPAMGKATLEAFWNTERVIIGNYKLKIILDYDNQKTEEVFDIVVDYNRITTAVAGRVVGAEEEGEEEAKGIKSTVIILAVVVALLVSVNIYIFRRMKRPPKGMQENKRTIVE